MMVEKHIYLNVTYKENKETKESCIQDRHGLLLCFRHPLGIRFCSTFYSKRKQNTCG